MGYALALLNNHTNPDDLFQPLEETPGKCREHQICVDGAGAGYVAYCVSTEYFVKMIMKGERKKVELAGKRARMIVAHEDGRTPMRVKEMDLRTRVEARGTEGVATREERQCRHCFQLGTPRMEKETDLLKAEASLMTAATVVAGTVLLIVSG